MLDEVVRQAALRFGDRNFLVEPDGTTLSFTELDRRSEQLAAGLAAKLRIGEDDVVCLIVASGIDYVVAYAALAKLGAITAGINPTLSPPERSAIVERADPKLVLSTAGLLDGLDLRRNVVAAPWPTLDDSNRVAALPRDDDRPVAIVFTSGTTGVPKGALFRVRQLRAVTRIDLGVSADEWGGGGPMIASTQFAHVGFMTKLPWYLQRCTTTFVLQRWRADDVLNLVARERIETLGVVAPQLALMLRSPRLGDLDVSCVASIIAGGAASPPALVREARDRFGAAYSIRYSSTESGGVGLGTAFDAGDDEALHTIGRPRPGVQAAVLDEHGDEVTAGVIGELVLRSEAMFDSYWGDPEATAEALRDGWLHTGDLATRIAEGPAAGCLRLVGRRREMYVRGGYNVYPAEVEAVLTEHPALVDVAIAPRPDDVMGEVGVAVIVVADGHAAPTLAELREFAEGRLARWKLPEALLVVDALPLTTMHKLDRRALAARVAGATSPHRVGD